MTPSTGRLSRAIRVLALILVLLAVVFWLGLLFGFSGTWVARAGASYEVRAAPGTVVLRRAAPLLDQDFMLTNRLHVTVRTESPVLEGTWVLLRYTNQGTGRWNIVGWW